MLTDLDLAMAAAATYGPEPQGTIIDYRDLRVVVNEGVVAVRGTVPTSFENWLRDFDVIPEESEFGRCHAGFLNGARGLFPMVAQALKGQTDYAIVGHSLGGAVAIILAAMLIRSITPPNRLVTFEAPKAGGAELRRVFIGTAVTQYHCGNDPVTDVFFAPGLYDHVRTLTKIGNDALDPINCHAIIMVVAALQPTIAKALAPVIAALFKP